MTRRILASFLGGFLLAAPLTADAAVARVQGTSKYPGSFLTDTLAFGSNVSANTLLLVGVVSNSSASGTYIITDTKLNSYTMAASTTATSGPTRVELWYAVSNGAGANTVSVTQPGTIDGGFHIAEYSGAATSSVFFSSASKKGAGSATSLTTLTFSMESAGDLIFSVFGNETGASTVVWQTGRTKQTEETGNVSSTADALPGSVLTSTTTNVSWTGANTDGGVVSVVFRVLSGGGAAAPTNKRRTINTGGFQ